MQRKILGILALGAALAACDDGTGSPGPGSMSLYLTDDPGHFHHAWVKIDRIELVGEADGEEGGVVLMDYQDAYATDLLTLSNDVATLVEDVPIPAGTYSQLRFVISGGCIVVEDAEGSPMVHASPGFDGAGLEGAEVCDAPDGTLQMPSFAQSGLKVSLPGGATEIADEAYLLLVDFSVAESFGQLAGSSGMWVMHPHIVAEDVGMTGSLTVSLAEAEIEGGTGLADVGALGDFHAVLAYENEEMEMVEEMPEAFQDDDGDGIWTATFGFLLPRSYEASVELRDGFTYDFTTDPTGPMVVDLPSGGAATAAFTLTGASAPSP